MTRGSYVVQEGVDGGGVPTNAPKGRMDSSFVSCILSLSLVFIFCLIIILASLPWKSSTPVAEDDTTEVSTII